MAQTVYITVVNFLTYAIYHLFCYPLYLVSLFIRCFEFTKAKLVHCVPVRPKRLLHSAIAVIQVRWNAKECRLFKTVL
jgi:hypothetical protein